MLYGEACLQETLGAPRIQDYVRVTTLPNGLKILGIESPQTHLRRAETFYGSRSRRHPRFAEANLRLGRVLTQLQRHEEALPYLRPAIAESQRSRAELLRTSFFRRCRAPRWHARPMRARSYERALAIFPGCAGGADRPGRGDQRRREPRGRARRHDADAHQARRTPAPSTTRGGTTTSETRRISRRCSTSCERRSWSARQ